MGLHVWRRMKDGVAVEYAETNSLIPPEHNSGWVLVSAPAIGAVSGAGGSPARPRKTK